MMTEKAKKQERLLNWAAGAECYEHLFHLSGYFRVDSYIYTKSVALMVEYIRAIYDLLKTALPQDKEREQLSTAKEAAENLSSLLKQKAGSQILNSLRNLYSLQSEERRAWSKSTAFPDTQQRYSVNNKEIKYCNLTKLHRWIAGSLRTPQVKKLRRRQEMSSSAPVSLPSSLRQYVNTPDILGWTPLYYAVLTYGKRPKHWVQLLMEEDADVNVTDIREYTPLHHSLMHRSDWIITTLLERGANVKAVGIDGMTPLHVAASSRQYLDFKDLLFNHRQPADQFAVDNLGRAPIHLAALTKNDNAIKQLRLSIGARDKEGRTSLHLAAFSGHWQTVRQLIHYGASLDEPAGAGDTMLHWAVKKGNFEAVDELLHYGATDSLRDITNWTPLHRACYQNHEGIARLLTRNGADVNATNDANQTPIMIATGEGFVKVVDLLLKSPNIELELRNWSHRYYNCTALDMAVKAGNIHMVKRLAEKGATIDSQTLGLAEGSKKDLSVTQLIREWYSLENCVRTHIQGEGADVVWDLLRRALLERDQECVSWALFAGLTGKSFCFL
jgi:ankyrin repeat protein